MFTFGNYVLFGLLDVTAIIVTILIGLGSDESVRNTIISGVVSIILIGAVISGIGWYNTNTASGARALKDYKSEIQNGIEREIRITAEDGREIFYYEGKVDVESNHADNYIKFESEDGKRYLIYYGIQDTITIIEK